MPYIQLIQLVHRISMLLAAFAPITETDSVIVTWEPDPCSDISDFWINKQRILAWFYSLSGTFILFFYNMWVALTPINILCYTVTPSINSESTYNQLNKLSFHIPVSWSFALASHSYLRLEATLKECSFFNVVKLALFLNTHLIKVCLFSFHGIPFTSSLLRKK